MSIATDIFQIVLICLSITFAGAPLCIWAAKRVNLIDYPGGASHKCHPKPTPMAGGLLMVLVFLLGGSLLGAWKIPAVAATFGAGFVVFLFGLWDDWRDLPPIVKLLGQILAAIILIRAGIFVQIFESVDFFIRLPFHIARGLNILLTVFWLVAITNTFNFIDSMDGLAVGIGGLVAGFFMLFSLDSGQIELAKFSAGLVALCVGVYFYNAQPAIFFLGDAGAQVLGFWLAALAIAYRPPDLNQMSSWFATILLLGVPIFDMALVVISRLRRGRPVYLSSRDHTYHRLCYLGVDSNRAVLLMHIVSVLLGCISIVSLYQPPLIANLIFGFVVICALGVLSFFEARFPQTRNQPEKKSNEHLESQG